MTLSSRSFNADVRRVILLLLLLRLLLQTLVLPVHEHRRRVVHKSHDHQEERRLVRRVVVLTQRLGLLRPHDERQQRRERRHAREEEAGADPLLVAALARHGGDERDDGHEAVRETHAAERHGSHARESARLVEELVEVLSVHAGRRGQHRRVLQLRGVALVAGVLVARADAGAAELGPHVLVEHVQRVVAGAELVVEAVVERGGVGELAVDAEAHDAGLEAGAGDVAGERGVDGLVDGPHGQHEGDDGVERAGADHEQRPEGGLVEVHGGWC